MHTLDEDRIAALFVDESKALAAGDVDDESRQHAYDKLHQARELLLGAAEALSGFIDPKQPQLVGAVAAAALRRRVNDGDPLGKHLDNVKTLGGQLQELSSMVDDAIDDMQQHQLASSEGRPPDLALRMLIGRAATVWLNRHGEPPSRSNSGLGSFGRFVKGIIARVPPEFAPGLTDKHLTSRIFDVLGLWYKRFGVSPKPRGKSRRKTP